MHPHGHHIEPIQLNSHVAGLLDRLVDIHELGEILGFDDIRSVKKWCEKAGIPFFSLGRRTYTDSNLLDQYIGGLMGGQYNPAVKTITPAQTTRQESNMSEASKKFLDEE